MTQKIKHGEIWLANLNPTRGTEALTRCTEKIMSQVYSAVSEVMGFEE
jgi:hypothetical protein